MTSLGNLSTEPNMADSDEDGKTPVQIPAEQPAAPLASISSNTERISQNTLAIGSRLEEFEIIGLVGEGGFGIVYLARDHSLERNVALKEYMPASLAARGNDASVIVRSERHRETFETGLRSFINEARLLAQFDHPALVKVYRFWEANGTAYMAMPYYTGKTLRDVLHERTSTPDESWIKKILVPVMEALEVIHQAQCFHRDIAPDNIMLLSDERPVLLDFGAARRVISDMTQALTVILKPGYAPIEQYAEMPGMRQGPWTDIYAMAAVVYFMITGRTPPPAVGRIVQDSYQPLAVQVVDKYSELFLRGIDQCLGVKADDRPQSIAEMRQVLRLTLDSPLFAPTQEAPRESRPNGGISQSDSTSRNKGRLNGKLHTFVIASLTSAASAAAIATLYWFFFSNESFRNAPKDGTDTASSPPASVASSSPVPLPQLASTASAPPGSPQIQDAPASQETLTISAPIFRESFGSVEEAIEATLARSDTHLNMRFAAPSTVLLGSGVLKLSVTADTPGYLYLFVWDKSANKLYRVFPNASDIDNNMHADSTFSAPRLHMPMPWKFVANDVPGDWQVIALLSEQRRDFEKTPFTQEGEFLVTNQAILEDRLADNGGVETIIGDPPCDSPAVCQDRFVAMSAIVTKVSSAQQSAALELGDSPKRQTGISAGHSAEQATGTPPRKAQTTGRKF